MNPNTQAILLLAGHFSASKSGDVKPLTVGEWSRFAGFLRASGLAPQTLLEKASASLLQGFVDKTITVERIETLLRRGTAMAVALEKWDRANVWVISRADSAYPDRLKKRLGQASPPILYGCGNTQLLEKPGIGIVGSRDVSAHDLAYTETFAKQTAASGFSVVSGGAKGVDQAAMLAALEIEGNVVGVLADGLLRATTSRQYRSHLAENNLLLITPFSPEAGFNAGNAMQRNRYVYCLSDASVVVHSGHPETSKNGKGGGTWTGAMENLKKAWVPLWVKRSADIKSGNAAIVDAGAHWLPEQLTDLVIESLLREPEAHSASMNTDIFAPVANAVDDEEIATHAPPIDTPTTEAAEPTLSTRDNEMVAERSEEPAGPQPTCSDSSIPGNFYDYFLWLVEPLLADEKLVDELAEVLGVSKSQLNIWLKQAVSDKKIVKLNKPIRYVWNTEQTEQGSLL